MIALTLHALLVAFRKCSKRTLLALNIFFAGRVQTIRGYLEAARFVPRRNEAFHALASWDGGAFFTPARGVLRRSATEPFNLTVVSQTFSVVASGEGKDSIHYIYIHTIYIQAG